MSNSISIPGAYNTEREQMIAKMMEAKREPVKRLEKDIEKNDARLESIGGMKKQLSELSMTLKSLFSFDNPFSQRTANSSDESIMTASAKRDSELTKYTFKVLQVAQSDSLLSKNITKDSPDAPEYEIPKGKYTFEVGKNKVSFDFEGGTLEAFSSKLNNKNEDVLFSKVVNISKSNKVFVLNAKKTGLVNKVTFKDDAIKLGLDLELIKEAGAEDNRVDFKKATVKDLASANTLENASLGSSLDASTTSSANFKLTSDDLQVNQLANLDLQFNKNLVIEPTSKAIIKLEIAKAPVSPTPPPPKKDERLENLVVDADSVTIRNITIKNEGSVYGTIPTDEIPDTSKDKKPIVSLMLSTDSGQKALPDFEYVEGQSEYTLNFDVQDMGSLANAMTIQNNTEDFYVKIRSIEITKGDGQTEMLYEPAHPSSIAQDAIIDYEGIKFNREKNTIDDVVANLTLNVKKPDEKKPVEITVGADKGAIMDYVVKFVSDYNKAVRDANVLTANEGHKMDIINNSMFASKEEEQEANKKAGIMQGESILLSLKNTMRSIVGESYPTILGSDFSILDDAGISTNPMGESNLSPQVLYGYLNVDTKKLESTMDTRLLALKEIFGKDTDGDMMVDTGIAFKLNEFISKYTESRGFLSGKTDTLKNENDRYKTKVDDYKKDIADFEKKLRMDLDKMDQASRQLEQSSKQMDNWFPKD